MKKIILLSLMLIPAVIFGQVRKVSTARETAVKLNADTVFKRNIPARMNTTQRNKITKPGNGQTIYNINTKTYETFNGTQWYVSKHFLGEEFGGGIIYKLTDNGTHGMIISKYDLSCAIQWYNGVNKVIGTYDEEWKRTGADKTALIVAAQITDNPKGEFAAKLCTDYSVKQNGVTYSDWFLPSMQEFLIIHENIKYINGVTDFYWTSDEFDNSTNAATTYSFEIGYGKMATKAELRPVRAIRSF